MARSKCGDYAIESSIDSTRSFPLPICSIKSLKLLHPKSVAILIASSLPVGVTLKVKVFFFSPYLGSVNKLALELGLLPLPTP